MEISAVSRESGLRCTVEVGHDETVLGLKGKVCAALWGGAVDEARLASVALCASASASASGDAPLPLGADDTHVGTLGVEAGDEVHLVRLHACIKGPATYTLDHHPHCMVLSPSGTHCAIGTNSTTLVYDTETQQASTLASADTRSLAFTPCGGYLLTGHSNSISIYCTDTWTHIRSIATEHSAHIDVAPSLEWVALCGADRVVVLDWDAADDSSAVFSRAASCGVFSQCGGHLVVAGGVEVEVWSCQDWTVGTTFSCDSTVKVCAVTPCSQYVVVSEERFGVRVFDRHSGACLHHLHGHRLAATCIAPDPTSRWVATSGTDTTCIWSLTTGALLHTFNITDPKGLAVSPCARWLFALGEEDLGVVPLLL